MTTKQLIDALRIANQNEELWGLIVYEIVGDGCLNGMWTNNDNLLWTNNSRRIMNEIARKSDGEHNNINGDYSVTYIDFNNVTLSGTLTITENNGIFNFEWTINIPNNNPNPFIFTGVGMRTGERQLTAIYWC